MNLEELKKVVEEKLGIPSSEIQKKYESELQRLKESGVADPERRALVILKGDYRAQLRSPAEYFEGVVLGVSNPYDLIRDMRETAKAMWKVDKSKAIADGLCDEEGRPLDIRENIGTRPNRNFGQPLPAHEYLQNVYGVVKKDNDLQLFQMTLGNKFATKINIPIGEPVTFRANVASNQRYNGVLSLNPWSKQRFDVSDIDIPSVPEIIETFLQDRVVPIDRLKEFYEADKERWEFAVVIGEVDDVQPEPNPITGNTSCVIVDDSIGIEDSGVRVWFPAHIKPNFGRGSTVAIFGKPSIGHFNDEETVMMNADGFYVIEMVEPEEAYTTEQVS